MSHVEASTHCRTLGDIQLRRNDLHGLRTVSPYHQYFNTFLHVSCDSETILLDLA